MKFSSSYSQTTDRGSVLIAALVFSAVIAISIASYLNLSRTTAHISNRALYNNAAMNLAENGLEEAMYSINKKIADPSYNWSGDGWDTSTLAGNARRKWSGTTFEQNATGEVRTIVYNYGGSANLKIVSRALVTLGNGGTPIEKWVEVSLSRTSRFANGLVAKDSIWFKGNNASVDSWNSEKNPDGTLRASPVGYSAAVKNDKGTVGSVSVATDAILVKNADIWGYAATGGAQPEVGPQGLVGPFGTPLGTKNPDHISTDFSANFDPVTAPTETAYSLGGITNNLSLPRSGDTPNADGYYYYTATQINFNNRILDIKKLAAGNPDPKVIITLTNATKSIDIGGGSGEIRIASGAELQIYAPGDIKIAGNGVMNGSTSASGANQPKNFQIWGTKTAPSMQEIDIKGNGVLSAIVYAPQGSVFINGNGDVCGSVVAHDITLVGNAAFHYDESLADFGGDSPFRVSKWQELSSSPERATHVANLTW